MIGLLALLVAGFFGLAMWVASRDPRDQTCTARKMPPSPLILISLQRFAQTPARLGHIAEMLLDTVLEHIGNTPLVSLLI